MTQPFLFTLRIATALPPVSVVWFLGTGWWIWRKSRAKAVEWTCCSGRTWNAEVQTESVDWTPHKQSTHTLTTWPHIHADLSNCRPHMYPISTTSANQIPSHY